MSLTVVIITLNADSTIEKCISSARWVADEILVIDSYSSDDTVSIATKSGARVLYRRFDDYFAQRNFAVSQAGSNWVLCIDADEIITKELAIHIRVALFNPEFQCYAIEVMSSFCGKLARYGSLYPRMQVRLFNRATGKWRGRPFHECWKPFNSKQPIGKLEGLLMHYPVNSWNTHWETVRQRAEIIASYNVSVDKDYSWLTQWFAPVAAFIHQYVFRKGFLDGWVGFQVAKSVMIQRHLVFLKTRKLHTVNHQPSKIL